MVLERGEGHMWAVPPAGVQGQSSRWGRLRAKPVEAGVLMHCV